MTASPARSVKLLLTLSTLLLGLAALAAETPPAPAPAPEPVCLRDVTTLAEIAGLPKEAAIMANSPGFCLDLGCGDGKLAAELAQKTKFYVFALAKDDKDCEQARQALDKTGVYGSRATAVSGSLKKLPLPDRYGNLVVTGDFQDDLDLKEVARVVNPNGIAVIGGGKTDAGKLKAAVEAAGIKGCAFSGNFAIFHGTMPEGTDEWTHFTPHPDNLVVSHETIVRPPFRTQWMLGTPFYDDKAVTHCGVADGRVVFRAAVPKPKLDRYFAFDAFNGTQLWNAPVWKSKNNYRFAFGDGLYFGTENIKLVARDPATGEVKKEFGCPGYETVWLWVAYQDGVLYALGSTGTVPITVKGILGATNLLCAFKVPSGELIWKRECQPSIMFQTAALDNESLYYTTITREDEKAKVAEGTVASLELKTGKDRWTGELGPVSIAYNDCTAAGYYQGKYFVWNCLSAKGALETKSFDAKTGQLVREYPGLASYGGGCAVVQNLFVGDTMYCNSQPGRGPYQGFNIETGAKVVCPCPESARDHPGTATANTLFCGGEGFCVYDLVTGKSWNDPWIRYSDFSDPTVAEGLFFHLATVCHCPHSISAPVAMAPAGENWTPPDVNENIAARLVAGPAAANALADDAGEEWTHYRGGIGHTGEVATAPKLPLGVAWETKLGGWLTPPSFGADLAFVGSRDGFVWGLDQQTGAIRWKFQCGAGVRVTPAYGKGRVTFGCEDGWVYCLDAKSGQLAWRFRAAPEERYINTEGQMASLWPSAAGTVMDGNIVYCAAGLQAYDGTYLYALNLQDGKVVWAKCIGDLKEQGSPQGVMAVAGDTLVVPVFALTRTFGYNKTNGEKLPWYQKGRSFWIFGSEAIADGDAYFYGGAHRGDDDHRSRPSAFNLMDITSGWLYGAQGNQKNIAPVCVPPVLGKQVIMGGLGGAFRGFDRAEYLAALKTPKNDPRVAGMIWQVTLDTEKQPQPSGLALAGEVGLASRGADVIAFEAKKDGKELSRAKASGEIRRNTLAVSKGRVFAVTMDGTVCGLSK